LFLSLIAPAFLVPQIEERAEANARFSQFGAWRAEMVEGA
jgi:hypothetical protein